MSENRKKVSEMSPEAKQAKREYERRWRAAHPEAVRRHTRNYWEKKAAVQQQKEAKE